MSKLQFIGQILSTPSYFSSKKYVKIFHCFICYPVIKCGPRDVFVLYHATFSPLQNDQEKVQKKGYTRGEKRLTMLTTEKNIFKKKFF